MANIVQLKRSSVSGRVPDAGNVEIGEPVVNLADRIIFTKNTTGSVIVIGAGTTSNVTEGSNLYFSNARVSAAISSQTLGNATFSANIAAGNVVITGASRLGTITSGTWNGSSISTAFTDAKIVSVSNTAPITATTAAGAVTVGMANSGVTVNTYGSGSLIPVFTVDQFGRITGVTDTLITASATGGFTASTTTVFPGHSGNVDYGDLSSITADAFGVPLGTVYDCMEPTGSLVSEDLAVL